MKPAASSSLASIRVELANPRGFCAGVERAIGIVEAALARYGKPIYVRHAVVHNRHVVDDFEKKGVVFIEDLKEVPLGAHLIFSAHGVSQAVRQEAEARQLKVLDATCPLVMKVHAEVQHLHQLGYWVVMIGHAGHVEVDGTIGQVPDRVVLVQDEAEVERLAIPDDAAIAFVTQTTLSMDDVAKVIQALQRRYPHIRSPKSDDICYATQSRQDAIKRITQSHSLVLILGSHHSSNSNRLREVAENNGAKAYLLDDVSQLQKEWLHQASSVAISAGASTPEHLVQEVTQWLRQHGVTEIAEDGGIKETITFGLPKKLLQEEQ